MGRPFFGAKEETSLEEQKRLQMTRVAAMGLLILGPIFLLLNLLQGNWLLCAVNALTSLVGGVSLFLIRYRRHYFSALLISTTLPILFGFSGTFYRNGMEYLLLLTLMGAIFMFNSRPLRTSIALGTAALFLLIRLYLFNQELPGLSVARYAINLGVFLFSYYWLLELFRSINIHYQQAAREQNNHLQKLTEELETANITKEKIFRIVSHDLRAPLLNLESTISLVSEGDLSIEEFRKLLPRLKSDVESSSHCLNSLLQWSSSQLGDIRPSISPVALGAIREDVYQQFAALFSRKQITLRFEIPDTAAVQADRELLSIILRNLLSNALKFTPEGGTVLLKAERETPDRWCLSVSDTGVGIPEEKIADLLNPHTLHSTRGTENERGLGLGLGICQELLQILGSSLSIHSGDKRGNGSGSTFYFCLPSAESPDSRIQRPQSSEASA